MDVNARMEMRIWSSTDLMNGGDCSVRRDKRAWRPMSPFRRDTISACAREASLVSAQNINFDV